MPGAPIWGDWTGGVLVQSGAQARRWEREGERDMSLNFKSPSIQELAPRITVFGVGGAGGNAVNNMIRAELQGVEFVIANTDAQAMSGSLAQNKIQLGANITRGLGAGARADVGRAAAEEALED